MTQRKQAGSPAVPFADSTALAAAASPVPPPAIGNKPAPGQTGPKGLAPRTSYSRVNTGAPPIMDAGASSQKGAPPDSMGMLPQKVAHSEVSMSATRRMTIQEMIKAAADGVASRVAISSEGVRQLANQDPEGAAKLASAQSPRNTPVGYLSSEYIDKMASAVEYIVATKKEAEAVEQAGVPTSSGPGQGPNTLEVTQTESSAMKVEPSGQGQATAAHQPPMNPETQKDPSRSNDPGTGLATNDDMSHPEQPEKLSAPIALIRKLASGAPSAAPVDNRLVDALMTLRKQAEDALNPAQISAGSAVEPETSAAGEPGGAPAGGQPQGPTSLIASNEAAINYTKGEAKKVDVGAVLTEPAMSSATDKTLQQTLDHTGDAGVKISSAVKTAAARALLEKLAADATIANKKKMSMGGMGTYQAPAVGGAAAAGGGGM